MMVIDVQFKSFHHLDIDCKATGSCKFSQVSMSDTSPQVQTGYGKSGFKTKHHTFRATLPGPYEKGPVSLAMLGKGAFGSLIRLGLCYASR